MKLQVGSVYKGFRLEESKTIKEINSQALRFCHEKSGAQLLYLQNEDDNKVFSVSFRTPPADDTGLPHILEHSVLCGSRKFPLKEPFVELIKGSLNTFLNAMTFSDKTMYPVASRNDKDFRNLMDVYLDAVFYPNIYTSPEILMQEGWHYELDSSDAPITYKGVVYNEMKGVFSSPESIVERKAQESLFPDNAYGFESGGDPEFIPNLTQAQFLDFHKKYYHPTNSYFYLYGDMDIIEQLGFIDEQYLSRFERINVDSHITYQEPFDKARTMQVYYPVSATEKTDDKTFLNMNFVVGRSTDPEVYLAFNILTHLLLGTPAAPLKKALIEAGIGKDVFGSYEGGILQPVFTIGVRNANPGQAGSFEKVVIDTLHRLVTEGIDKSLVEASVNLKEFQLREANYGSWPKGLVYNLKCMHSWLYDADPTMHLEYENVLERVKEAMVSPYFEDMITTYLLSNNHRSLVVAQPKIGLEEERTEADRRLLSQYKDSLSQEEIVSLIAQTAQLKERQATVDPAEALACIPLLTLDDIESKAPELPQVERTIDGVKVLAHPLFTNKIAYIDFYFDSSAVPQELLHYLILLTTMLGKVSTGDNHYSDLSNLINIHTGGIQYASAAYDKKADDTTYQPKLVVKTKALVEKIPQLMKLLGEILGDSRFDDHKRLKEIISEVKAKMDGMFVDQGHLVAMQRLISYFSPSGKYAELSGLPFYRFITALEQDFAVRSAEVAANLAVVANLVFNRQGLLASVTMSDDDYGAFAENFALCSERLGDFALVPNQYHFDLVSANEGLMTASKVQYVAKGSNFRRLGYRYTGSMRVLETILRFDYLWNRVRVQGGAYGAFAQFDKNGNMVFASYRDPNLSETLRIYDETENYLRNFAVSDREMGKYIIGTMSKVDTPLTPSMKGERATGRYIQQITPADVQRDRDEILATRQSDIRECADLIKAVLAAGNICVLGNEEKIKNSQEHFRNLVSVFE